MYLQSGTTFGQYDCRTLPLAYNSSHLKTSLCFSVRCDTPARADNPKFGANMLEFDKHGGYTSYRAHSRAF